ncbi:hypothetical protein [Ferrovibrio sp.]|uniref:hypothetical protein n=1 Tax=Ferrovibrio sp. TaxID=1917215 RepID=UPI00262F0ADD|nr:hypothetical protein [Ferrovibrio sp.]
MRGVYLAILLAMLASGCSRPPAGQPAQRSVISPNGEPLGRTDNPARCEELLGAWFASTDRDNDGRLSDAEWLADAEGWFRRVDADRDGFVTVSELTAIRRVTEPEQPPPQPGPRGDRNRQIIDRAPDPVMAADTNLDFRVSPAEFRLLSEKRHGLKSRDGAPDRASILADCRRY